MGGFIHIIMSFITLFLPYQWMMDGWVMADLMMWMMEMGMYVILCHVTLTCEGVMDLNWGPSMAKPPSVRIPHS